MLHNGGTVRLSRLAEGGAANVEAMEEAARRLAAAPGGDVLVLRVPLGRRAREVAQAALARI